MNKSEGIYEYYNSVKSRKIEWLWYPYIPYGKITLLQGDPGDGKSTFALNLAAIVTKGGNLPDNSKIENPQVVIYQCSEDGNEDTIKPRLIEAKADCSRVAYIIDKEKSLSLEDNRLEEAIATTGARLLVLDPIQAFIPQDGDMCNAVRMRSILKKLSIIAEKYSCAILLIGHMNKSSGGKKLYRGMGSIDIAAIARSVLMITRDDDNPEFRYMFPIKSSLAPEGCAIGFILDKEIGFRWIGKCNIRFDENKLNISYDYKKKKEKTKDILKLLLSTEECKSKDILKRMENLGICEKTVRKAQKELGIVAYRKKNIWYWKMPEESEE